MRIPERVRRRLFEQLYATFAVRQPDLTIGGEEDPYLRRWYVIPRNPVFNVYLHQFLRSDDDRALHDHPWVNLSVLLAGSYREHTIRAGGIHDRLLRQAGDLVLRLPRRAHRVELVGDDHEARTAEAADGWRRRGVPCWTLFLTGPRVRAWGFHCEHGWRHWRAFTEGDRGERVGRGCA